MVSRETTDPVPRRPAPRRCTGVAARSRTRRAGRCWPTPRDPDGRRLARMPSGRREHAAGPDGRGHDPGPAGGGQPSPDAAPGCHPDPGGRQPEGRRRQDHDHGQHRRRAGAARSAGPGDRPRPSGQRLDRVQRRPPARRPLDVRRARGRRGAGRPGLAGARRAATATSCRPRSTWPAPRSSWSASWPARTGCAARSSPTPGSGTAEEAGEDRYDYVFVDCPPSLGLLTLNALVAGDEMLIPIQAEYYALEGLGQLLETVEMVKAHLNPAPGGLHDPGHDVRRPHPARVRGRRRRCASTSATRCSAPSIPRSVRVSEAPSYGQTVMTYDPASPGALSYLEAARELVERGAPR